MRLVLLVTLALTGCGSPFAETPPAPWDGYCARYPYAEACLKR